MQVDASQMNTNDFKFIRFVVYVVVIFVLTELAIAWWAFSMGSYELEP